MKEITNGAINGRICLNDIFARIKDIQRGKTK
jgi:hypothetical protein